MEILFKNKIAQGIKKCNPSKIAVAYIGTDWDYFISNPENLEDVIISPTIGSYPWAIEELADKIGWIKVHFLKELHAKIFIGQKTSIIGSANLTKNGLSGDRLIETCVKFNTNENIQEIFNELLEKAQIQYPNEVAKKNECMHLKQIWRRAYANGIIKSNNKTIQLLNFTPLTNQDFYVCWCRLSDTIKYSSDIDESVIDDEIHFLPKDKVELDKWVLVWKITEQGKPSRSNPYWLYIHDIHPNGIIEVDGDKEYPYRKCAIQRNDKKIPPEPFKLTKEVRDAFKKAIIDKEISKYLIQSLNYVELGKSFKGMPLLIEKMKQILKNK